MVRSFKAFTIIETVMASAILAGGLIGVVSAFRTMVFSSLIGDQTVVATNIAKETMEKIIAQRDCDENGCGYSSTLNSVNVSKSYDQNPVSGFNNFVVSATALEVDPDNDDSVDDFLDAQSSSGYARISVNVSWNNGNNSIDLHSLITDYPTL